jgi:hypothetical protein
MTASAGAGAGAAIVGQPDDGIRHCPVIIQEGYNRLHMIQHQTRETPKLPSKSKQQRGPPVLPSRVTRTSFDKQQQQQQQQQQQKPNDKQRPHIMFGMLDQMLVDDDESSSQDDDFSCASAASYNSLCFGDDGVNLPKINDHKSNKVSSSSTGDEDTDSDTDSDTDGDDDDSTNSWNSDDDGDDVGIDGDDSEASINSSISDVTVEDLLTIAGGGGGGGHNHHHRQPYHSNDESATSPLTQQLLVKVSSRQALPKAEAAAAAFQEKPPLQKAKKPQRSVRWYEKVHCRLIRHINDYTDEEVNKLFINRREAAKIRKESYQLIQLLENEQEMLAEIEGQIGRGEDADAVASAFQKNLLDCVRGLERHTMDNNEEISSKRDQVYASVFKIQSLNLPSGLMDVPGTIAEFCAKLSESSVAKAVEMAARDEQEAYHVHYGEGQLYESS